eukprot:1250722-Rhodomonas_salina.2
MARCVFWSRPQIGHAPREVGSRVERGRGVKVDFKGWREGGERGSEGGKREPGRVGRRVERGDQGRLGRGPIGRGILGWREGVEVTVGSPEGVGRGLALRGSRVYGSSMREAASCDLRSVTRGHGAATT